MKTVCYFIFTSLLMLNNMIAADVSAKLNLPEKAQPGSQVTIEITVNKGNLSGFGKFNQDLPTGWNAVSGESAGGTFTFTDRTVKIIWVALPSSAEFKVTIKVQVPSSASGPYTFSGKFNYIENGQKQTLEIKEKTITIGTGGSAPAATQATTTTNTKPAATTKPATTTTPAPQPAATNPAPAATSNPAPSANDLSQPSADQVVYKVQFGVFSKPLPKEKTNGIPEVNYVQEGTVYKYSSGSFSSVQAAQLRKQEVAKKGFPGAIIVGYKNGVRVEVIK